MRLAAALCLLLAFALAQAPPEDQIKALYAAKNWPDLQKALADSKGYPLYRAGLAVALNQDSQQAETTLRSVIKTAPHSEEAYEAYERLSHLYLRAGQYRRLMAVMEQRWAAFPEKKSEREQEEASLGVFRGLPDQAVERFQPSIVPHEGGSIFIPLSINGNSATYFFDTGAGVSAMSESEAKRLGLSISERSGTGHTMTADSSFRTAVAKDVRIGGMRFRDVTFAVYRDSQEPWSVLPSGRKGIIGVPLILAFRTLRWVKDGALEIGQSPRPLDLAKSNLYFNDDHIVIASKTFQGQTVHGTLDTGAESTDLFSGFAKQFAPLLESGKKDTREIRGVGGAATYASITVPEVAFRIGGVDTLLRPAQVIANEAGAKCCAGNFGMDLLKQGRAFKIDFSAMRLELEPNSN